MSVIRDLDSIDGGTWIGIVFVIGLLGLIATTLAVTLRQPACAEWAQDGIGSSEYSGEEFQQRYDACIREQEGGR